MMYSDFFVCMFSTNGGCRCKYHVEITDFRDVTRGFSYAIRLGTSTVDNTKLRVQRDYLL
jgi:hypothetical protein